jgi:6-phosphofructokinase 1
MPELKGEARDIRKMIETGNKRKKSSNIIIVAEGDEEGGAIAIAEKLKPELKDYEVRVSILGHLQRGGSPSALDRVNASRLGHAAVEALLDGQQSVMVGLQNDEIVLVPFRKAVKQHKGLNQQLVDIIDVLNV